MGTASSRQQFDRFAQLNQIGIALSAESDTDRLLERILLGAKQLTQADGGTLYLVNEEQQCLEFAIVRTESLNIALGGTTGNPISDNFKPIPLYQADGSPNEHMIAAYAVLHDQTVNIPDAYNTSKFDFSGTRRFDASTGYRSTSFLTVPMKNHQGEIIAVLQLLNKLAPAESAATHDDPAAPSTDVIAFDHQDQQLAQSLASQAAVALTNKRLIDELKELFDAFIQIIASAIDEKSPHTGGHCRRLPDATMLLAEAASRSEEAHFRDFTMTGKDRYELETAAWLHDCGKVTTPVHVIEKSTKLETIHDRIELVACRFEILYRDLEIQLLRQRLEAAEKGHSLAPDILDMHEQRLSRLKEDLAFIRRYNLGSEFMSDEAIERVREIARYTWQDLEGKRQPLISDDELANLTTRKGTLNPAERKVIENHMTVTLQMLESLPFPKHLARVPEYAGGHHERMDGRGYPRGLTREQMSIPARVMGIADVFEALTAPDRPYKQPMKLSQALEIMGKMKLDNHLDPDLFDLFVRERVYLQYAEKHLHPSQIDVVDHGKIPGYSGD